MFGANLVILAQIYDKISHGQTEFPRILSQNRQNNLEGQGQCADKAKFTDRRTDAGNDITPSA